MGDRNRNSSGGRLGLRMALVALFLSSGTTLATRASEPLFLQQALEFRYDRWQQSQADTVTDINAQYNFALEVPALSYRLGNIAFSGTVEYDRLSIGSRSDASIGLTRYGFRAFLFPYRRFHLAVDYQHSVSQSHFGASQLKADTYGLQYILNSPRLPRLDFIFRYQETTQDRMRETWTLWSLTGDQRRGRVYYKFNMTRQEMGLSGGAGEWAVNSAYFDTDISLREGWWLRGGIDYVGLGDSDSFGAYANLNGTFRGWTSSTQLSLDEGRYAEIRSGGYTFSQSVTKAWNRFILTGSGGVSSLRGDFLGDSKEGERTSGALQVGGTFLMGKGWSILGELGLAWDDQRSPGALTGNIMTYHLGVGQGGSELPSFIRRPLFFVSDLSFQSRVRSEYPPGYVPSELADLMAQRRLRQMGSLQFSADYYRSEREGGGERDWARVTGTLRGNSHFYLFLMGDWVRDHAFYLPGHSQETLSASLNLTYAIGRTTLLGAAGYNEQDDLGQARLPANPWAGRRTSYYSLGFTTRFRRNILGFLATRYDNGDGLPLTTYSVYDTLAFRKISFRVVADWSRRSDGYSVSRISVDILRLFDTVVFAGNGWR